MDMEDDSAIGCRILVVEDELEAREFLEMALRCEGYAVELAEDGDEAVEILLDRHREFCAVFLDILLPRKNGLEALREIREITRELPVFITSGATAMLNVVEAMRAGATDFIPKPLSHEDLRKRILSVTPHRQLVQSIASGALPASQTFWGNSKKVREIESLVRRLSTSEAPLLIQGETGSGKEVLAREIHAHSPRADQPFVKLNCAALPSELVESELFGYERGAFTGAFQRKSGMFDLADRGTILLDEIGDMPHKLQAKLLQVLQDREFQRLGGKETVRVDVRVMAATHRNLEEAIRSETFREDLYYRLNVITIEIPPLRERQEDIIPLAHFLLQKHTRNGKAPVTLDYALQNALLQYDWPGNVRELENIIRRMIILRDTSEVVRELSSKSRRHVPLAMAASAGAGAHLQPVGPIVRNLWSPLTEVAKAKDAAERGAILRTLESTRWNRKRAARLLNIDYKALLYKMKKLSIGKENGHRARGLEE